MAAQVLQETWEEQGTKEDYQLSIEKKSTEKDTFPNRENAVYGRKDVHQR